MTPDEALLFKQYDTRAEETNLRTVFHSAINDPTTPEDAPPYSRAIASSHAVMYYIEYYRALLQVEYSIATLFFLEQYCTILSSVWLEVVRVMIHDGMVCADGLMAVTHGLMAVTHGSF